jgi:hypothetical protein
MLTMVVGILELKMKIKWYDWLLYRLFSWRWGKIMAVRPDLREIFISWLKAYDTTDINSDYVVTVSIKEKK